jgi:hypothetical protein
LPAETAAEFAERTGDDEIAALAEEFGRLRYGRTTTPGQVDTFEARVDALLRRERVLASFERA